MTPTEALAQAHHDARQRDTDIWRKGGQYAASLVLAALPEGWGLRLTPGIHADKVVMDVPASASWVEDEFPDEAAHLMLAGAQQERERYAERVEAEWYNGNMDDGVRDRLLADPDEDPK